MKESQYRKLQTDLIIQSLHTQYIGKEVIFFDTTDSTNIQASMLGEKGAENGTLVLADTQTKGKGRLQRAWFSPNYSNLYFSILLRPPIPPKLSGWISLACGVALAKVIRSHTGLSARIKWPNDILVNGKKLGGILIESHVQGDAIKHLILGIGINVNTSRFPKEISNLATSLKKELGHSIQREPLLVALLKGLEDQLESFYQIGSKELSNEWKQFSDSIGKQVSVTFADRVISGLATDLDTHGELLLEMSDGTVTSVISGDIVHLRNKQSPAKQSENKAEK